MSSYILNFSLEPEQRYKELVLSINTKEISDELNEIYKAFLPKNLPGIDTAIKTMMKLQKNKVAYLNELVYWQKTLKLKFHKLMILQVLIELNPDAFKKFAYTATVNSSEILCYIGFVGFFSIKSSDFFLSVSSQKDEKYKSDFDYIKNMFTKNSSNISKYILSSHLTRQIFDTNLQYYEALGFAIHQPVFCPMVYKFESYDSYPNLFKTSPIHIFRKLMKYRIYY